jgi:hypothetical protein
MLSVGDVQVRYGLHDPRSARQIIRDAGGRMFAGRLMIRADVLDAWETTPVLANTTVVDQAFMRRPVHSSPPSPLSKDWYRECAS